MISICEDAVKENPSGFLIRDAITLPPWALELMLSEVFLSLPGPQKGLHSIHLDCLCLLQLSLWVTQLSHGMLIMQESGGCLWVSSWFWNILSFLFVPSEFVRPSIDALTCLTQNMRQVVAYFCSVLCIFNSSLWVWCPDGHDVCRMNGMTWSRGLRVESGMNLHLYKAAEPSVLTHSWFLP